jgi:predicted nucleotide-binding protein
LNIKALISNAFDNPNQKLDEYNNHVNWFFVVMGKSKTNHEEQEDYLRRLASMKNLLKSYQEELQMIADDDEIDKVQRNSNEVFIIHGHDKKAIQDTKTLLYDCWGLKTIILSDRPGEGRTLIEKFEEEAKKALYAFAILTPDDVIRSSRQEYLQARPNVVFELGWFYGRLGRKKVCILNKKGTVIHSDLHGISRIEFDKSIYEKVTEIKNELEASNIISQLTLPSRRLQHYYIHPLNPYSYEMPQLSNSL